MEVLDVLYEVGVQYFAHGLREVEIGDVLASDATAGRGRR
jgi:hypothetical protein